jgi:hypothetical protein
MKEELIEQWQFYNEFLDKLVDEMKLGFTKREQHLNFHDFMIWLETGRLNTGVK